MVTLPGVVGGEIIAIAIAIDKGLGQSLADLGFAFTLNGVMALLLVLVLLGVSVVRGMTWIGMRLLHWQSPHALGLASKCFLARA